MKEQPRKLRAPDPAYVSVPEELTLLEDGDKFTCAGVKWLEDGTITMNCKPGEETMMTARKVKKEERELVR